MSPCSTSTHVGHTRSWSRDWWDEKRDARLYAGPNPVVAHPPCQLWGSLAYANYARWGGEHNLPGNDGGSFARAVWAVRMFGGVLEHPAKTRAWAAHELPKPVAGRWTEGAYGWVCEVWQSAYGHKANKATWLYYCGPRPPELNWERPVGTHQCGFQDRRDRARNKPTLSKREASESPLLFAQLLLDLAARFRQ